MSITDDEKKFSDGVRSNNRQPYSAGSNIIWPRRQIQLGVNWELNYSFEKG
jgi:hypothetical protein